MGVTKKKKNVTLLDLKLGYSHFIYIKIPSNLEVFCPEPSVIFITGDSINNIIKLKKFKKFKNSFYNLTFIKIKYYLVNILIKNDLNLNSFKSINLKLKILLKVLFEFHKLDKNIVFIGFHNQSNYYNFSVLFKKFNYKILNKNVWINGILFNFQKNTSLLREEKYLFFQKVYQFDFSSKSSRFNTISSIFYIFNSNIGNISKKKVSSYIYFLISAILIKKYNCFYMLKKNQSNRYKPLYKKFIRLRKNVQNKKKFLFGFKKKKWKPLLLFLKNKSKRRKQNFVSYEQLNYSLNRYISFYKKNIVFIGF